jgi:hypothetical protein
MTEDLSISDLSISKFHSKGERSIPVGYIVKPLKYWTAYSGPTMQVLIWCSFIQMNEKQLKHCLEFLLRFFTNEL